jgi:hypothetical protein
MKNSIFSLNGAIVLSLLALVSNLWRGFLDAMFVLPFEYSDETIWQLAAISFTVIFVGWAWALLAAWRGSRIGLVASFVINALVLVAIPISWLLFYCPAECRAEAAVFNLANTLNLVFGLLAAVSLGLQFRRTPQPAAGIAG